MIDLEPIWLTARLALITTAILFVVFCACSLAGLYKVEG